MRPEGRVLRSVLALFVETSYISPKPKRCVERKVLKCLTRIIANFHPVVGVICKNTRESQSKTRSPSAERVCLSLYSILPGNGEMSREKKKLLHPY